MSKIRKWSELLTEKRELPSKIFWPGEMYEYDSGQAPVGATLYQGDILVLKKEPGLTAYMVPGTIADWQIIKSAKSTASQMDARLRLAPGLVVANMGNSTKSYPETPITSLFRKLPLSLLLDTYGYGICRNRNNADPTWTPCGNHMLQITMPFHVGMKRCLIDNSGNMIGYLNPNDSNEMEDGSPADLSGIDTQVMVEIPPCFRYHFVADNIEYVYFSAENFDVDEDVMKFEIKKAYVSAYEAALDHEEQLLSSCVNKTERFLGGDHLPEHESWEGDKSLFGRPITMLSLAQFRDYARARGRGWGCMDFSLYNHICWLFFTEYLTFNSQATTDLGAGVTTWTSAAWNSFNAYNPFVPCGTTNRLGNASGNVELAVNNTIVNVPSYRGIENIFGHIWKWTDGILADSLTARLDVYLCENPEKYDDVINDFYHKIGELPTSSGYYKQNIPGYILPISTSPTASATTGLCDNFYAPSANAHTRGLLFGGSANSGTLAGLSYANANHAPSYGPANLGSRLCFISE